VADIPVASSAESNLRRVLLLTAGFMIIEAVGGWVSGSLALLADAGHMLTDVGALALALVTARMARRPADPRRTYGYLRLEILAALVNGVVLAALSAWIIFEAIRRFRSPHAIEGPLFAGVALAGLVVNLVALRLLKHDSHGNLNTRAAYLQLEQPSQREPVRRYASVEDGLYGAIVDRCVDANKMCQHQMMAIDAAGGLGKAGVVGVTRQPWRAAQGDQAAVQRTVVAALCTPANPTGEALSARAEGPQP